MQPYVAFLVSTWLMIHNSLGERSASVKITDTIHTDRRPGIARRRVLHPAERGQLRFYGDIKTLARCAIGAIIRRSLTVRVDAVEKDFYGEPRYCETRVALNVMHVASGISGTSPSAAGCDRGTRRWTGNVNGTRILAENGGEGRSGREVEFGRAERRPAVVVDGGDDVRERLRRIARAGRRLRRD
ncbi:hypothetical protein EVAR_27223_1 [Eumeta japonica]|uniref:Uncharacterized protein n=1 Tax=Eumeta variegata TaxID=151549 RepID=A0A4C1VWD0_EUMVA|nr:hypothetical protein EVAR_27223_1 [Eumeta japonica]